LGDAVVEYRRASRRLVWFGAALVTDAPTPLVNRVKAMSTSRSAAPGFLIVLLLLLSLLGCSAVGGEKQPTPIPTPIVAEKPTYKVERGDVILKDSFTGRVVLSNPVALSFKEDGRIKSLDVHPGDAVKKDQVLAQLDISDLTKSLNTAQFGLDQDGVKLANSQKVTQIAQRKAELDLDIKEATLAKLKATGAGKYDLQIAQDEVDLAKVQVDELKASVDEQTQRDVARDQTLVDQIKSDIEGRTIRAPMDAIVTDIADKVAAGAAVSAFQQIIQLGDPSQVEIAVSLSGESNDIAVGQTASATVARLGDKTFLATLRKPEGATTGNSNDQAARFSYDTASVQLKPGETVYLSVVLKNETNVLWLPPNAIRTFMGRTFVVLRDGGVEKRVDVEVGTKTNDRIVVRQGLTEGQVVIGP
jgi:RND family efflux transporter MFP subunit